MFFDSSVRSMRTISLRSPTCSLSAAMCDSTSGSQALFHSFSPSTPSPWTPMRVMRPSWETVLPETLAFSRLSQQSMNARAHRSVRNPAWSAPRMPSSTSLATSSGSREKYSGGAHGVWLKCAMRRSGRSARSIAGVSVRW
ncbi:hypothetical protein GCM10020219_096500 [Nonomuraea dietziae]